MGGGKVDAPSRVDLYESIENVIDSRYRDKLTGNEEDNRIRHHTQAKAQFQVALSVLAQEL